MKKHKIYALGLFILIGFLALYRNGWEAASIPGMHFFIALIGILFCEFFAFISPFGYWANIAKDRDVDQQPAIYAFLFWVLFIATGVCLCFTKVRNLTTLIRRWDR